MTYPVSEDPGNYIRLAIFGMIGERVVTIDPHDS